MRINCLVIILLFSFCQNSYADSSTNVEDFVRQTFIEGIPFDKTENFDEEDVQTLLEMLTDKNEDQYWSNIVVLIEMIGDESVIPHVIRFIEDGVNGEYSETQYRAKQNAIYGLGYLLNRHQSPELEKYLEASIYPSAWNKRNILGLSKNQKSLEERNEDISKYAILALALSGTETSYKILKKLKADDKRNKRFTNNIDEMLKMALAENEKIRAKGLLKYHQEMLTH